MARPTNIKDETIVAAARELFLERGIRVTTAEVAHHAGVSEGSIFNRFPTKEHLFRAAMESQLAAPQWFTQLDARVGKGDPRESLLSLAGEVLGFFRTAAPLMMMMWSNHAGLSPRDALEGPDAPPVRAIKRLSAFFAAEARLGRVRNCDPEILARAFLGGIANYAFIEALQRGGGALPLPAEPYLRGLIDLLWRGFAPEPEKTLRPPARRANSTKKKAASRRTHS